MTTQTSYPVFESGQVLTSLQLNDLAEYLEQQDRLTRNKLVGIGIVCGFDVTFELRPVAHIRISAGCAVTSEGYLIAEDVCELSKYREYKMPASSGEEGVVDLVDSDIGNILSSGGVWELLRGEVQASRGEAAVHNINRPEASFRDALRSGIVMLFLECKLESLRNCDISDCSDKGREKEFTLRRLLISRQVAEKLREREDKFINRPSDKNMHPKYELKEIHIEKINPAKYKIDSFYDFTQRVLDIGRNLRAEIVTNLKDSFEAYKYVLSDMFPAGNPFLRGDYFSKVFPSQYDMFAIQYLYDYWYDLVQSYNEFLKAAMQLEAECCPNPDRFPKHVLLGAVGEVGMQTGAVSRARQEPSTKPVAYRHHFIPSMLFDRQHERRREVRSLFYRTWLLAQRYDADGLFKSGIKITPSRDGAFRLSEKAIPFYYQFNSKDDLHRNWSFHDTVENQLERVFSHRLISASDHPLKDRMQSHNFYRIEGVVGKGLGDVMRSLLDQKQELGLSFGIEPVHVNVSMHGDDSSEEFSSLAKILSSQVLRQLLVCRLGDMEAVFLSAMSDIFGKVVGITEKIAGLKTLVLAKEPESPEREETAEERARRLALARRRMVLARRARPSIAMDRTVMENLMREVRPERYERGTVTRRILPTDDPAESVGALYAKAKENRVSSSNLLEYAARIAPELGASGDPHKIAAKLYPSLSVLDKAERVIEMVGVKNLNEFDPHKFDVVYKGFMDSIDVLVESYEPQIMHFDHETAAVLMELEKIRDMTIMPAPQSPVKNLTMEFERRMMQVAQEMQLKGYAQKHPGMEHKCGVPVGGTFVLLYAHRKFLEKIVQKHKVKFETAIRTLRRAFTGMPERVVLKEMERIVPAVPSDDHINDFIVIGDFCLPYLCCETDCSDMVRKPVRDRDVKPGILNGKFYGPTNKPIQQVNISVIDISTMKEMPVKVVRDEYNIEVPPGLYKVITSKRNHAPQERIVVIRSGAKLYEDFHLKKV